MNEPSQTQSATPAGGTLRIAVTLEPTLKPGDPARDFNAIAVGGEFGDGKSMQLSDYFGEQVILYFYPQDHTPGCTAQACKLRDAWAEFGSRASLFGVSVDSPETHREVIELHSLPFPLI